MAVFADLQRRTGVGAGGAVLYVLALAAGMGYAFTAGHVNYENGKVVVLITGLVYAVGLLGVVWGLANLPRYVRLRLAGRTRTGDVTDERVAVEGRVRDREGTLRTPFGDEPAVCYTTRVLERRPRDDGDGDGREGADDARSADDDDGAGAWSLVTMAEDATRFAVDDGSGPVAVDPAPGAAAFHLGDRTRVVVDPDETPPEPIRRFLAETDESVPSDVPLRFEEAWLAPGDAAFVYGRAARDPDPVIGADSAPIVATAGYPERVRDRVVLGIGAGATVAALGLAGLLWRAGAL
ncbi:MAG: hypothetical protein ABEJ31_15070 [Haloarculaceae archaeon]